VTTGRASPVSDRRHVVLVGAGHANLLVVRAARRLVDHGIHVTLVDPDAFWYSGMAAAVAGGVVHPGRDRVDPLPLAVSRGVDVRRRRAAGLDTDEAVVVLDDGTRLGASAVVLNVGSDVDPRGLPVDLEGVTPVKPTRGLLALRDELAAGRHGARVVVVGAGASALEVAANLSGGPVADAVHPRVTLVADGPVVPVVTPAVRARLLAPLLDRGVVLRGGRVTGIEPGAGARLAVEVDDGTALPAEHVVLATGLRASASVEAFGVGDSDGMPTRRTLQHPDHPWLLGAGDAIRFGRDGLPRLGVFAVRQAPVLVDNLLALHGHGRLRRYEPQQQWVTGLDLGDGDALVVRGGRWVAGRPALVLKRLLDEWFLRRHRVPVGSSGRSWGRRLG
jgi:NADH dehydrogenase FAD-containing subunit